MLQKSLIKHSFIFLSNQGKRETNLWTWSFLVPKISWTFSKMDFKSVCKTWQEMKNVQNVHKQNYLVNWQHALIKLAETNCVFTDKIFGVAKTKIKVNKNHQITYQINSLFVGNENCTSSVSSTRFPNTFWIQNGSLPRFFYKVETMARKRRCRVSLQNFFRASQFSCQNSRKTPN